ncbi:MAG TPA: helix-turn-helix transcriptional regulator [Actinophytocola sp.]|uniref:helix-turn-helix transcriptional regulator n=1 Tax=Actinophytocola sp. TaxID=1872138 RepID=UPI002DDC9994|nr:helix-turn-helix transcriptional regulator [Actinophytocola sp.]HEV2780086.1 helix-turn-helix transcriptional regulator [Actinophytocola sp.]
MLRHNKKEINPGVAVPSLVRWGLSADADLVFRSLSTFGSQPVRALAADLGLSTDRVRSALEELEAVGIARPINRAKGGRSWAAAPVELALATVRRRSREPTYPVPPTRTRRTLGTQGLGRDLTSHAFRTRRLPTRSATRTRIAELVAMERWEHLVMNPELIFSRQALTVATPLDLALVRRGVHLRALGRRTAGSDKAVPNSPCCQYRESADIPHQLMIFDRRVALLAIDPGGTLEIGDPPVVAALVALFNRHWDTATDPRRNGVPPVVLTPREKAIITLLAQGHTDTSAAQHLGLSTRSVTYTLRGLMDRLGVENRFQLGLALGAMGAATPSPPANNECGHEGTAS